jgi:cobyrinic acid a,c-diamide synthase
MSIVIAGERSGSGKTTVTLALLAALTKRGDQVQSFKVGPDYIDPMFHAYVTGRPCYNLDPVLTSLDYLRPCVARHTQNADVAVVEGVMGLFDGAVDPPGAGSTAEVARQLKLPILLVVNCQSMSHSIAALVKGFTSFDPHLPIAGVVLNKVGSDRHLEILTTALKPTHIPILGVFRREDAISLPDRHLGLVPIDELPELREIVDRLAVLGEKCFDWHMLQPLLAARQEQVIEAAVIPKVTSIAVAKDAAFSFYYAENLELLESLGAELVYWSPLKDQVVPDVQGLYFGGGFPEVFAAELAANVAVRESLLAKIQAGMPTYGECGGLMYLTKSVTDFEDCSYPMVGALSTTAVMGKRLTLGYRLAVAQADTPLVAQGEVVKGHEFHRSTLSTSASHPLFHMQRSTALPLNPELIEGWHLPSLHASYLHLHWGCTPQIPQRFIQSCIDNNSESIKKTGFNSD